MSDKEFIKDYLSRYNKSLFENDISDQMIKMKELLLELKNNGKKVIIAGNGGSAAMASHATVDFMKQGGIRTINFNEYDLITCFANDYGYENWVAKALEFYADKGDLVILISSSGSSKNILKAAKTAKHLGLSIITFSGIKKDNLLEKEGEINFWVDSKAYNIIENTHLIWLLMVCDLIIGNAEYSA